MQHRLLAQIGWLAALMVTALLDGCTPVKSLNPLLDKEHLRYDPDLVGKWVSHQDQDEETLYVLEVASVQNDPKSYSVTLSGVGGKSEYRVQLGQWDKDQFAEVESVSGERALDGEWFRTMVPAYAFFRIRREGDVLRIAYMDSLWAEKNLPQEKRRDIGGKETDIVFTGSTGELQEFVLRNAHNEQAFLEFRFAREGTLAAYSQSLEVGYEGSAKLYAEKRQYEQAAIAWARYLEVEPKDPDGHSQLATALLGSNKSGQAREEFAEATRLCAQAPRPRDDDEVHTWCKDDNRATQSFSLGVACFLLDQYEQANHEFEQALLIDDASYEPVIWDYLALRGAGKAAAARDLVERSAKKTAAQLRLAQYMEGQITEAVLLNPPKEETTMGHCEVFFVIGSEAAFAADKARARESFEKTAQEKDCSALMAAAASARLKQLAAKEIP